VQWYPTRVVPNSIDVVPETCPAGRLAPRTDGYPRAMLYTILIVLAIIALLVFIFGRRRV